EALLAPSSPAEISGLSGRNERQPDEEACAAAGAILDLDDTTEAADKMPGDGKTEAGTPAIAVARSFQTQERLEDPLAFGHRDARPAIIDQHDGLRISLRDRHRGL